MASIEQTTETESEVKESPLEGKDLVQANKAELESHGIEVSEDLSCLVLPPRPDTTGCDLHGENITSIDVDQTGVNLESKAVVQENGSNIVMTNQTEVRVEKGQTTKHEIELTLEDAKARTAEQALEDKREEKVVVPENEVQNEKPPELIADLREHEEYLEARLSEEQPFETERIEDPVEAADALENGASLQERMAGLRSLLPGELANNSFDNSVITSERRTEMFLDGDPAYKEEGHDLSIISMPDLDDGIQTLTQVAVTKMPNGRSATIDISKDFKRNSDTGQFDSGPLSISVAVMDEDLLFKVNSVNFNVNSASEARELLGQVNDAMKERGPAGIDFIREKIKADNSGSVELTDRDTD